MNISSENEADELSELLDEILNIIPYEEFDHDFIECLDEKKKEFEEPEIEYDDDWEREFVYVGQNDDTKIEEMMTSLRVNNL